MKQRDICTEARAAALRQPAGRAITCVAATGLVVAFAALILQLLNIIQAAFARVRDQVGWSRRNPALVMDNSDLLTHSLAPRTDARPGVVLKQQRSTFVFVPPL
jgi:hypothetical protein